jgi:hypothetical protein
MAKKSSNKFQFGIDFQELILKYTLTEEKGFKILSLYEDSYFTLISHAIIAYAIKKYYKKKKRIPEEPFLRETLRNLYQSENKSFTHLSPTDHEEIDRLVSSLYIGRITDPDSVIDGCIKFAKYVTFKANLESVDIDNYDSYAGSITKFQMVNSIGDDLVEDYGTWLVGGMKDRAYRRDQDHGINSSPFWQMNRLLNSGGILQGNLIVFISKEKKFKTGALINVCRNYMRMRKKGIYFDFENGEKAITTRSEQSVINQEQKPVSSGQLDEKLLKLLRKYKRIGAELVIKRMPAFATCNELQAFIDKLKRDKGYVADYVIADYLFIMGSISSKEDDFGRISDATLDLKNLAEHNKFESVWAAAHVTREGDKKRTETVYESTDIAKCMDIPRHADAVLGIQQNKEEKDNGVIRVEVVEQRNGMDRGKMLFWLDIPRQRMKEFNKTEIKEYYEQTGEPDPEEPKQKPKKRTDL